MTIRGHHFRRGVNKNTVAFKRTGAKAVLVRAEKGTTKMLRSSCPSGSRRCCSSRTARRCRRALQVRVLSARFGKRFTAAPSRRSSARRSRRRRRSPADVDPNGDCDGDGQINRVDTDDDNDLLTDDVEKSLRARQCKADTDGDGVEDGYEYQSARDLNDDEYQTPERVHPVPGASVRTRTRSTRRTPASTTTATT